MPLAALTDDGLERADAHLGVIRNRNSHSRDFRPPLDYDVAPVTAYLDGTVLRVDTQDSSATRSKQRRDPTPSL